MSSKDRLTLFKFLSPESAINVLHSGSLRWSSPQRFKDPFELGGQTRLNFDTSSLLDSMVQFASSLIFAPEGPTGDSPLINAINRWRTEERFSSEEEAHGVLRELLIKMVEYRLSQIEANLALWQTHIRNTRVCCFFTDADRVNSWEQFAANHAGLALGFSGAEQSSFGVSKPVVYQAQPTQLTSLKEQLGAILNNGKDDMVQRFHQHHRVKAPYRTSEAEWRCLTRSKRPIDVDNHESDTWYDDLPFESNDLTHVYFGLATNNKTKASLRALVQAKYPQAKIYQTVKSRASFNLNFSELLKKKGANN